MARKRPTPEENRELVRRYQAGLPGAAEALVARNEGLCGRLAGFYVRFCFTLEHDDLMQEGRLGVLRAGQRFDFARHMRFSSYATGWIRAFIVRAVNKQDRLIRIPVGALYEARAAGTMALLPAANASLDFQMGDEEDVLAGDMIPDPASLGWEERLAARIDLDRRMACLTPRERLVVGKRIGLAGGEPETLQEVGDALSITRQGVAHVERKALGRLRGVWREDV